MQMGAWSARPQRSAPPVGREMQTDTQDSGGFELTSVQRFGVLIRLWREKDAFDVVSQEKVKAAGGPSCKTQQSVELLKIRRKRLSPATENRYNVALQALGLPEGSATDAVRGGTLGLSITDRELARLAIDSYGLSAALRSGLIVKNERAVPEPQEDFAHSIEAAIARVATPATANQGTLNDPAKLLPADEERTYTEREVQQRVHLALALERIGATRLAARGGLSLEKYDSEVVDQLIELLNILPSARQE